MGKNWEKVNDLKPLILHNYHTENYIEEPSNDAPNKATESGKYEKWKNKVNIYYKIM